VERDLEKLKSRKNMGDIHPNLHSIDRSVKRFILTIQEAVVKGLQDRPGVARPEQKGYGLANRKKRWLRA
jgi:hypothetical protein